MSWEWWIGWLLLATAGYGWISILSWLGWRRNVVDIVPAPLPVHIFIPAHNESATIGNLLDDLLLQKFPRNEFTVTVVDDRSQDDTAAIVARYQDRLPIRLLQIEKLPPGIHGKLYAMYLATSDLTSGSVLMVDADCRVGPDWIRLIVENSGPGGAAGAVFELPINGGIGEEILSIDQAAVTYPALGLIARKYPITASTANLLIPVESIRSGLWSRVGTNGTGEDGRIIQDQFAQGKPVRAVFASGSETLTKLAGCYRSTAAARRRWYNDATTYSPLVKVTQALIALALLGLMSALVALVFEPVRWFGVAAILTKYLFDGLNFVSIRRRFPYFTMRSFLIWSPLQSWLLMSYAILPAPKRRSGRGFADQ